MRERGTTVAPNRLFSGPDNTVTCTYLVSEGGLELPWSSFTLLENKQCWLKRLPQSTNGFGHPLDVVWPTITVTWVNDEFRIHRNSPRPIGF
tara:strand:- start:101 stop:376 length:276 start_codon:yes stop_codon:yes gene_type:complete